MVSQVKLINYIADYQKNPVKRMVISNDAFSSPVSGQVRYDSTLNILKWYNGTAEASHLDSRLDQFQQPTSTVSFNNQKISNLGSPTNSNDAVNKSYVDNLSNNAKAWKEILLVPEQLSNANDCILQSIGFYLSGNPSVNNIFILFDGSTLNVFSFKASRSTNFEVTIGATANDTLTNLVNAISLDSTIWNAVLKTNLNSVNSTDGYLAVIYRRNQALASYTDRIYGTFTTQANAQVLSFLNQFDYSSSVVTTLSTTDPSNKMFGFGRVTADLVANETHAIRSGDSIYTWDNDSNNWQVTSGSSYTSSNPISLSGNTFSLNYSKGLELVGSNLEIKLNSNSGLVKNTGTGTDELSINTDETTIERNGNNIRVKDGGISSNKLATDSVTTLKILDSNVTGAKIANNSIDENKLTSSVAGNGLTGGNGTPLNAGAGTGITVNANDIQINKSLVPTYYSFTITGDGSTTIFPLTHNAGTNRYNVTVINNTTGDNEEVNWGRNSSDPTNKVDVLFSPAPANGLVYNAIVTVFG